MKKRDDLDLNHFKELLLKEKARLEKEIAEMNGELNVIASQDDVEDPEELADLKMDNDRDHAVLDTLKNELKDVEDALKRIAEGTYGFDEKTGKKISKERLEAYPAARTAL
jgi:RNA polymerase-binding transcription factor DksA